MAVLDLDFDFFFMQCSNDFDIQNIGYILHDVNKFLIFFSSNLNLHILQLYQGIINDFQDFQ